MLGKRIASQSEVIGGHRVGLQSMLWESRTSGSASEYRPISWSSSPVFSSYTSTSSLDGGKCGR